MNVLSLQLAPHELAPNRRASWDSEPFAFRAPWCGGERDFVGQIVAQTYDLMIFFALTGEPQRGNFVSAPLLLIGPDKTPRPACEPRTMIPIELEDVVRAVRLTADEGWGRLYYLDEQLDLAQGNSAHWRLFLAQSGWGQWSRCNSESQAVFRWNENADEARRMALLPPRQLWNQTRAWLLDGQSDAALARAFVVMRADARRRACRPVTRGSYDEWKQVLLWYLLGYFPFPAAQKAKIVVVIHDEKELRREGWEVGRTFYQFDERATQFCEWTRRYFAPRRDEKYLKRCSAAVPWARRLFIIRIAAPAPSQHERLEACLQLRAWLLDRATPHEIERLLQS